MAFTTESDMPVSYFRAEEMTLFQRGSSIFGWAGGSIFPNSGESSLPNGYHEFYFEVFVAGKDDDEQEICHQQDVHQGQHPDHHLPPVAADHDG